MTDYRDTLDPRADSEAQQRQINSVISNLVTVDTGTTYTYVLADANGYKRHLNAASIAATVPPNSSVAFPIGTKITVEQTGAGQVTITAGSGVTVNMPATLTLKLKEQWSVGYLTKVGTNVWTLAGGQNGLEAAA